MAEIDVGLLLLLTMHVSWDSQNTRSSRLCAAWLLNFDCSTAVSSEAVTHRLSIGV
jgi:hypothetical protein